MSEKLSPSHLEKVAYIYVRQSSLHQVRHNREGQRRQYDLSDLADELGFQRIEIVDEDLGISGTGRQERQGFARLLTAVCEGKVGAVLALEASRLARNNRDWHHLIDLCALTGTVVIDHDGIYDPQRLNDRLLLGLKGTMSEFELGLLHQRAREALLQMIRRGDVLRELPVGYVRTEENGCEMTPDLLVQAAVRGVLAKFVELGSARQVLLWYNEEELPLPSPKSGTGGKEVVWRDAGYQRILSILKNPTYAGAFVHGRRQTETQVIDGRARKGKIVEVPQEDWKVLIHDHHPAYITWKQYLRNQEQLQENSNMKGQMTRGSAREGTALLAGMIRCARCSRKLLTTYNGKRSNLSRYECRSAHTSHAQKKCISFSGNRVDQAVVAVVLEALQPAGVEAALDACRQLSNHENEKRQQLKLAVEKANYEVDRARRQYDSVEPENRLVAAELGKRWNDALDRCLELEKRMRDLIDSDESTLSPNERERLLELGQDLETLWSHPDASVTLKKRILRSVIKEIIADVTADPPQVILNIHWYGGVHTPLNVRKNRPGQHSRTTDRQVVDLVRELSHMCDDLRIALILNRLGYKTGAGNTWTESRVNSVRRKHQIEAFDATVPRSWLTLEQAADALEVSCKFVKRLLTDEILPGRQVVPYAPWMIERASLKLPEVKAAVAARAKGKRPSRPHEGQQEIPLFSKT